MKNLIAGVLVAATVAMSPAMVVAAQAQDMGGGHMMHRHIMHRDMMMHRHMHHDRMMHRMMMRHRMHHHMMRHGM